MSHDLEETVRELAGKEPATVYLLTSGHGQICILVKDRIPPEDREATLALMLGRVPEGTLVDLVTVEPEMPTIAAHEAAGLRRTAMVAGASLESWTLLLPGKVVPLYDWRVNAERKV